jgi:hypothetical protein
MNKMNLIIKKATFRLLCLSIFYILYLFIGAAVFSSIEYSNEKKIIENLKSKRQDFLTKHSKCLNGL